MTLKSFLILFCLQIFIIPSFAADLVVRNNPVADLISDMASMIDREITIFEDDIVLEDIYFISYYEETTDKRVLFGVRPEFIRGSRSKALGGAVEWGILKDNGFYWGTEFMGGYVYYGGLLNIGGTFNSRGTVKNTLGLSAGYQYKRSKVNVWNGDILVGKEEEDNHSFGGVFHRLLVGNRGNFNVTNRLLFGYTKQGDYTATLLDPYPNPPYNVKYDNKLHLTYSLGVGWALLKNRNRPETDEGIYAIIEITDEDEEEQEEAEEIQGGEIQ